MKAKDRKAELAGDLSALTVNCQPASLNTAIECKAFSCLQHLLWVTALVFKFIKLLKAKHRGADEKSEVTSADMEEAELCWIREVQWSLMDKNIKSWKQEWNLFEDERGVVRCQGRFGLSDLVDFAKYPILLDNNNHFTTLVVWSCHRRVFFFLPMQFYLQLQHLLYLQY